jgi:hypothetical protein
MNIGVKVTSVDAKAVDFEGLAPVIMVTKICGVIETGEEKPASSELEALFKELDSPYIEINFKKKPVLYHEAEAALEKLAMLMLGLEGK